MAKTLFVLASKSPRRKELLKNMGIQAEIIPANIDEDSLSSLPPEKMVTQLALLKATDVARSFSGKTYVIAADTIVVKDGEVYGKPRDISDARRMLENLSGETHSVYTGYCVIRCSDGTAVARFEKTDVTFRAIEKSEINEYIKSREPMDKAGAYGIQGKGSMFIEKINGDYFNVVGLPVCALSKLLREEFGINVLTERE